MYFYFRLSLIIYIYIYIYIKCIGPAPLWYQLNNEKEFLLAYQELLYFTWIHSRNSSRLQTIPTWIGFKIILTKDVSASESWIGYLDCLDSMVTDNSTIHYWLCRPPIIKEKLGVSAIFAKAVEILLKQTNKQN